MVSGLFISPLCLTRVKSFYQCYLFFLISPPKRRSLALIASAKQRILQWDEIIYIVARNLILVLFLRDIRR